MLDINKKVKSKANITDNLIQTLYSYIGLDITIFEINYLNKKFMIERKFQNNLAGRDELHAAIKEFDSEEKVRAHFGLK